MFAGWDRMDPYPESQLRLLWTATNLRWAAFYLSHTFNPQPPLTAWSRPRASPLFPIARWLWLQDEGWGLAPTYLGHQMPSFGGNAVLGASTAAAALRTQFQQMGAADAVTAARLAIAAQMEANATIYLDSETSGFIRLDSAGHPLDTPSFNYLSSWFATLITQGYRPGSYCSVSDAAYMAAAFPSVAIWPFDISRLAVTWVDPKNHLLGPQFLEGPNPYNEPQQSVISGFDAVKATDFAVQFDQLHADQVVVDRTTGVSVHQGERRASGRPLIGVNIIDPARPANRFNTGAIDLDWARLPDPSHPERRGSLAACPASPGRGAIVAFTTPDWLAFAVRDAQGQWPPGLTRAAKPTDAGVAQTPAYGNLPQFDPAAVGACYVNGASPMLVVHGLDGSVVGLEQPGGAVSTSAVAAWPATVLAAAPAGSARATIRKASPMAVTSRTPGVTDAFLVNVSNEVTTIYRSSPGGAWTVLPISPGHPAAPASEVAVIASDPNELQAFFIDWENAALWWLAWTAPTAWQQVKVAVDGQPTLRWRAAPGVAAVFFRGEHHVLAYDNDQVWDLHRTGVPTAAEVSVQEALWAGTSLQTVTQTFLRGLRVIRLRLDTVGPTTLVATLLVSDGTIVCVQRSGGGGWNAAQYTTDLASTGGALATAPESVGGFLDVFVLDIQGRLGMLRYNTLSRTFLKMSLVADPPL